MNAVERRQAILELLQDNVQPQSAAAIAGIFHVSRQIIVGDIALLRASGAEIYATPRGYICNPDTQKSAMLERVVACRHSQSQICDELYAFVDNGCGVLDVTVEHAVYGQISGQLHLFSRYDVDQFLEKLEKNQAVALSRLTGGTHLHKISYPSVEVLDRVLAILSEKGILFQDAQ